MSEGVTVTQTAQKPVQLTLAAMLAKFQDTHPQLVAPFEHIKPDLEQGTGQQALANLIHCEVKTRTEQGLTIYTWEGRSDTFELSVPKPFNPHPQRPTETQQQAQVQEEPQAPPEAPQDTPEPAQTPEPQPEDVPELKPGTPELPEGVGTPPATVLEASPGMFAALAALLGDTTLLMTVARTGKEGDEPVLTVTVVPQVETESFTPVCLTGTVSELDTHFVAALESKAENKKSLEQAVADLKAADKELEEAKKVEAETKRKQAASKKKAAEKKEEGEKEPAKVEAAPPESPKPEPQEALF